MKSIVGKLNEDIESPFGPTRGRYLLTLNYVERYAWGYGGQNATLEQEHHSEEEHDHNPTAEQGSTLEQEHFTTPEQLAAWLEEVDSDLVTLWPEEARALGQAGTLLPLYRFGGAEGSDFAREFFPHLLDPFRENGMLFALPVGANPLMLYFDADYFAQQGIAPPDDSWDWDILVDHAIRLTQREKDGTVSRWGLDAHGASIWWALWQNSAEMGDTQTPECRLQESPAIEALQFVRGLIHTHGVSPAALGIDLARLIYDPAGSRLAMLYNVAPFGSPLVNYRRAELPMGKVRSVPVSADPGIAIVAQTAKPEAAYRALRGLVHTMQPYVNVPAEREAVARMREYRRDLHPEEIVAIQHSMELGRSWPDAEAERRAMYGMMEALVRGDDVASMVNQACSILNEDRRT